MTSPRPCSVIICTHNPRPDYLRRTLDALKTQTLPVEQWEVLLIDNASKERLADKWDLSRHPNARHVREEKLGLTHARLCGIGAAAGDIVVFIDDDNVIDPNYLKQAMSISNDWPMLGAWGGQIVAEFEEAPAKWSEPFLGLLAIREFQRDIWANSKHAFDAMPCGAGMIVRKSICSAYKAKVESDPRRALLGRRGANLASCEDSDLAYTAIDLGYGFGLFQALKLTHLIPKVRVSEDYLIRLIEQMTLSTALLNAIRAEANGNGEIPKTGLARLSEIMTDSRARQIFLARRRGKKAAARLISSLS